MAARRKLFITHAGALAHQLVRAVRPEGLIARFVHSYARQHGREGVVNEPARLRELESTMGREAVLVMVAEVYRLFPGALGAPRGRPLDPEQAAFAKVFWLEFMDSLGRALEWPQDEFAAERESLDTDLLMYRRWIERAAFPGAGPGQTQVSPFCDRCALLLDPSLMDEARRTAAEFETEVTRAAARILGQLGRTGQRTSAKRPAGASKRSRKAKASKRARRSARRR
jgi:hypothetical protein